MKLEKPVWFKYKDKEIEKLVLALSKKGLTSEKIGLVLRDTYGIPTTKIIGKKVSQILKENEIEQNADIINMQKITEKLKKHMEKHKHDFTAKRSSVKKEAKLKKLKK